MRTKEIFSRFSDNEEIPEFEKLKVVNPDLYKKLTKQFDTGRQIIEVQANNGFDRLNEQTLRLYLIDFAKRLLKYGPNSFPTSYNVLEPFFTFNRHNSVMELIDNEESYGVSLLDFVNFITESNFNLDNIDLFDNIPDKTIFHFTFTSGFDEINFSNGDGKTFLIGSLSMVRQGNEVSMLIQAGESYNKDEAEQYFKKHTRKSLEDSISPYKKSLGLTIDDEDEPKVVHFNNREDLWLHSVSALFDLESKSLDIRHVGRDDNINYHIITDDFNSVFRREDSFNAEEIKTRIKSYLDKLSNYDAVFDFAKYCLALPFFIYENEDRLVDVTYETNLKSILSSPVEKRKYSSVPQNYKVFAKPFYYLESDYQTVISKKELEDKSFNIEKTGYWKRLKNDEEGFDKKGRTIIGKTWVERNDIYYSNPKGITKVNKVELYNNVEAGYIYIMRQPSHEENIFKIGLTQRSPEIRRKELSNTSSIDKFFVINSYHTKDCFKAEKEIHNRLEEYRLSSRREFFICELRIIIDTCESVIKEINN